MHAYAVVYSIYIYNTEYKYDRIVIENLVRVFRKGCGPNRVTAHSVQCSRTYQLHEYDFDKYRIRQKIVVIAYNACVHAVLWHVT